MSIPLETPQDFPKLSVRLLEAGTVANRYGPTFSISRLAASILVCPQAHIDTLVEAGVLHEHYENRGNGKKRLNYTLQPAIYSEKHDHDWRFLNTSTIVCIVEGHDGEPSKHISPVTDREQLPKWEGEVPA